KVGRPWLIFSAASGSASAIRRTRPRSGSASSNISGCAIRPMMPDGSDMVEWTMAESPSLSITLDGRPDLLAVRLKELYGITGRSSDALRRAIAAGEPIYSAALFGNDHIDV